MRPLLPALLLALSALLAVPAAAAAAAPPQADWRQAGIDDRVQSGLTSSGWRLETDGRALDPKTKAPATKEALDKAVIDLRQNARRAALESLNLMLEPGRPADIGDNQRKAMLAQDLPPGLAAAVLDPASDLAKTRAMAAAELDKVAAYFDGGRTMSDREAAAQPVAAGTPGPRVDLPYYSPLEKSVGEKLQASAAAEIGRDPFGRTVLSRLNGKSGRPDLPPIVIEEQNGPVAAQYDFRRGAIVLDRESVVTSIVVAAPPARRGALRSSLAAPADLLAYLEAHPEAVASVAKENDVVLVHELTHAWQDRRDPIFREIARGNLPDTQPLEYEEEAYKTKNLYLRSKLKNDPASVRMDEELADYRRMTQGLGSWKQDLFTGLEDASPARALPVKSAREVEAARLQRVRDRAVSTDADQRAKALDLSALTRGGRQLAELDSAHAKRMAALDADIDGGRADSYKRLGSYYLVQALNAPRAPDREAYLDQAERYAKASGSKALMEEVRKAKEKKP